MSTSRFTSLSLALLIVLALLAGCQREEPPSVAKSVKKPALHVVVPEEVRAKWKAVQIVAHDKQSGRDLLYTVDTEGGRFALPGSNLEVEVAHFLPAFVTDGKTATSVSNAPSNPGIEIVVREAGVETFRGWLLRNAPADHAFQHPRYTLALQDFIARR
ncbi:MAG: DUF2155 domain-containing protein [Desulfuromonas sp.]|nr:DUF2155 domain-containing protein [Desulfuromonas sp.]